MIRNDVKQWLKNGVKKKVKQLHLGMKKKPEQEEMNGYDLSFTQKLNKNQENDGKRVSFQFSGRHFYFQIPFIREKKSLIVYYH